MTNDPGGALSGLFRGHFGHGEHLYGLLLDVLADDLDDGGVTAHICRDHLDAGRADAIPLRLLAGIQRIVLRGDAPAMAPWYADPSRVPIRRQLRRAVLPLLQAHIDELHVAVDRPPQTNEPGRSACLLVGLFTAVRRYGLHRIRLLEPGAAAGLNLNVDRYRYLGDGWSWGPADSPLVLDTGAATAVPEALTIVDRRGCDLSPVNAADPEDAAYLTSFVCPFDTDRRQRLAAGLTIAARHPPVVDRAAASTWLQERLAVPVADDVLTVVWQSITQQYWPESESAAVARIIAHWRERFPLAHITMEGTPPSLAASGYDVRTHGPQLRVDGEVIARSHHHGPPVVML